MDAEDSSVIGLYIYPIKACKGISLNSAPLSPTGFLWDRCWMLINSNGRMLTQRVEPKLALVEVSLPPEALTGQLAAHSALCVGAPGMELLKVPLLPKRNRAKVDNISVWEWSGSALDEGNDAADWFSRYLGKPCRLVRFDSENSLRPTDSNYASGYKSAFSDEYPLLLISQASLDALNERLPQPLSINRFRPNIFVQGCSAFAEDLWKTFTIAGLTFHGVKLCARCKVTTIEQETGQAGEEPLRTLRSFRSGRTFSLSRMKDQVFFGQNVVCEQSQNLVHNKRFTVSVGDKLMVLEKFPSMIV